MAVWSDTRDAWVKIGMLARLERCGPKLHLYIRVDEDDPGVLATDRKAEQDRMMDSEAFVSTIREVVRDGAVKGVIRQIEKPAGRKPRKQLLQMSAWYATLNDENRHMLVKVIEMTADQATFDFLCVIDGSIQIENGPKKGTLNLIYEDADKQRSVLLSESLLHEMY